METQNYLPLVNVFRGPVLECIHYGAIAVCDPSGRLVFSYGNVDGSMYLRSTAKPIQVLPFVE
ncbi:MAG: asparaginase, partial [Anaerolineaceae bacterium]|nr:asparaginase [Anaerolineaceae bacterium]